MPRDDCLQRCVVQTRGSCRYTGAHAKVRREQQVRIQYWVCSSALGPVCAGEAAAAAWGFPGPRSPCWRIFFTGNAALSQTSSGFFKTMCCVLLPQPRGARGGSAGWLGHPTGARGSRMGIWGPLWLLSCSSYRAQGKRRASCTEECWSAQLEPVCSLQLELSFLPQDGCWRLLLGARQGKSLCYSPGPTMSPTVFSEVLVACGCPSSTNGMHPALASSSCPAKQTGRKEEVGSHGTEMPWSALIKPCCPALPSPRVNG